MKKNILYIAMACLALGFTACSDDPEDAVEKHVYGPDEAPYLRADASATIAVNAEFRKGHVSPKTIYLKDYAEQMPVVSGIRLLPPKVATAGGSMPLVLCPMLPMVWPASS